MNSTINRKKFLKLSAWGFLAALLPVQEIKALSFISDLKEFDQSNYQTAIDKAKKAKEHFYKKEFTLAENLYLECIQLAPADIRFYDNLQNVYGAQGELLRITELFKNALIANPSKVAFYDRAARSLMRLELGDRVLAQQYKDTNGSHSLLKDAKTLYNQAIAIDSTKEYLKIGRRKVKKKIAEDAPSKNYRTDSVSKEEKKRNRKKHNKRYKKLSIEQLKTKIDAFENRNRNTLYLESDINTREKNIKKEKKLVYRSLIKKLKKEREYNQAIAYAESLYEIDRTDQTSLTLLKRLYRKDRNYTKLINVQRTHAENSQKVYAYLGLMHFLQLAYKKQGGSIDLISQSIAIGEDLANNWPLVERIKVDTTDKLAKSHVLYGDYQKAQRIYKDMITTIKDYAIAQVNKVMLGYALTYFKTGDFNTTRDICLIAIEELNDIDSLEYVQRFADKRAKTDFIENIDFYYLLTRVYKRLNQHSERARILNFILSNDPDNKFALKRIS